MEAHVCNLRHDRAFAIVEAGLFAANQRTDAQIPKFSVQANHIHLLVEADDRLALSRMLRGLAIRLGRRLNALMGTRGKVIAHRYHARALPSPTQVRNALFYVLGNHEHHAREARVSETDSDIRSSSGLLSFRPPAPRTWLLRDGWRRGRGRGG
jgi:REP element-mobilizing transposase RayT